MIPLFLIALGLGAAYVLLPSAKAWADDHLKALENAFVAHKVADAHLQSVVQPTQDYAQQTQQIWDAIRNVQAAITANQVAAASTADAGNTARTEQERQAVAQSAREVLARQEKIAAALKQLGGGQCGVRSYRKVSTRVKDAIIAKLKNAGMSVTGSNPWDVDPRKSYPANDVRLRALWDQSTETLHLIVSAGKGDYVVTCDVIWGEIEPILKGMGIVAA